MLAGSRYRQQNSIKRKFQPMVYISRSRQLVAIFCNKMTLQWRHNERDGVLDHQPHDCLLNHWPTNVRTIERGHYNASNNPYKRYFITCIHDMMTLSNGKNTRHLISAWTNGWVNNQDARDMEAPSRWLWRHCYDIPLHYIDVIMTTVVSQITSLTVV